MSEIALSAVPGADIVINWFGAWPSFHDAEIISLMLARHGESVLRVYPYHPAKPATVNFVLEDVTDIELQGFSCQNVIFDLRIEIIDQNGDRAFRLILHPCYGLAGRIDAKLIRMELHPGESPDGLSNW